MRRARFGRAAAIGSLVLAVGAVSGGVAMAASPQPSASSSGTNAHSCGRGLHAKQQSKGSGLNLHHCGHGLHQKASGN
jgi:hypothetical protein